MDREITSAINATHANGERGTLLGQLLTVCAGTMGATLLAVALGASLFSLFMGYRELSRRAETATPTLLASIQTHIATGKPLGAEVFEPLGMDPDLAAAAIADLHGAGLVEYRTPGQDSALTALQPPGSDAPAVKWLSDKVVAQTMLPSPMPDGRTASLVLVYDSGAVRHRAIVQLMIFSSGAAIGLVLVLFVIGWMFHRQMSPLRGVAAATIALADGDYGKDIPALARKDDIGAMARAVDTFKTKLLDREQLQRRADMVRTADAERHARIGERVESFRSTIRRSLDEVAGLSDQMTVAADGMAAIATQTNSRAEDASAAIRRASASVTTVAGAAEDLANSIREIERQVDQTRQIVMDATKHTAETGGVIQGLLAKAEEIGEIIELIQTIAAQTNLLSLNATIEAARAGESGRGFAVVAQEVKTLAGQTAKASQRVAEHILSIQTATSQAVSAIEVIDATMTQADRFSSVISVAVERQAGATAEISRSAADAALAAEDAAGSMRRLAAAVGETDQSALQVHQSATDVGAQAQDLSATIDGFLNDTAALRGTAA